MWQALHLFSSWFRSQLIFLALKMEARYSSETSVDTQRTTRRYIPEDRLVHDGPRKGGPKPTPTVRKAARPDKISEKPKDATGHSLCASDVTMQTLVISNWHSLFIFSHEKENKHIRANFRRCEIALFI
jgi:hypothetical protein